MSAVAPSLPTSFAPSVSARGVAMPNNFAPIWEPPVRPVAVSSRLAHPVRLPEHDFIAHTGSARSHLSSAITNLYTTPGFDPHSGPTSLEAAVGDAQRAYDELGMASRQLISHPSAKHVIETARGSVLGGINALTGDTVIAPFAAATLAGSPDVPGAESYFRHSLHLVDVAENMVLPAVSTVRFAE